MHWQIYGHDWAVSLLSKHAAGSHLRHAYLLTGPEGVGRRTLALRFIQALNCSQPPSPGEFCGECRDCRQIHARAYPDLSLLEPEAGHREILIDQVRSLQHTLSLAPYAARYRVALLPQFERTRESAANALLKTLEEPSDKVILLLTADAAENLLPTIVSRCEVLRLRPASLSGAREFLQSSRQLPPDQAELIAHLSAGRIGAALRLAENPEAIHHRQDILNNLLELLTSPRHARFQLADTLTKSYEKARVNAAEVIPIWLSFWRDVLISSSGADVPLVNIDFAAPVKTVGQLINAQTARALVIAHEEALKHLDANANVRLLLEVLLLDWPILEQPLPPFTVHYSSELT